MKYGRRDNLGADVVQNRRSSLRDGCRRRPYRIPLSAASSSLYIAFENDPRGSFGNHVPYVVNAAWYAIIIVVPFTV